MNKPKLLYASPLWPKKSGISEYSEILVQSLKDFFNITLLIDNYRISNKSFEEDFEIVKYEKGDVYKDYDAILYNIGNSPDYHSYMYDAMRENPGYIILHDFVLYFLTTGYYRDKRQSLRKIYEMEGIKGLNIVKDSIKNSPFKDLIRLKDIADKLPLNKEILEMAKGIFVHSDYTKKLIQNTLALTDVYKINFVKMPIKKSDYSFDFAFKKYGIPKDAFVIGAIGFIAPTKQNELTCKAIKIYNDMHKEKIYYFMIGDGNCADPYLKQYIIKTGFLENSEYEVAISRCNLVFNLRYPTNGETSATLIQCMSVEIPCVVTDIGWFHEVPDDCVGKLPSDITASEIANKIAVFKNTDWTSIRSNAYQYVNQECNPQNISRVIYQYIIHDFTADNSSKM